MRIYQVTATGDSLIYDVDDFASLSPSRTGQMADSIPYLYLPQYTGGLQVGGNGWADGYGDDYDYFQWGGLAVCLNQQCGAFGDVVGEGN